MVTGCAKHDNVVKLLLLVSERVSVTESVCMKLISGLLSLITGLALILGTFIVTNSREEETVLDLTAAGNDASFIVTAPGVLNLVADEVTVTLTAEGQEIQWGLAPAADVQAYIGENSYTEVSGLTDWDNLAVSTTEGSAEADAAWAEAGEAGEIDLAGSDLWIQSGRGENSVSQDLTPSTEYAHALVATTSAGIAPDMTLSWVRSNEFSSPVVWYVIGTLLALIGTFLLLNWYQDLDERQPSAAKTKPATEASEQTSVLPVYKGDLAAPGTSREIQRTHTDSALGASILPGSARADSFRNRELSDEDRIVLPVADEESAREDEPVREEAPVRDEAVVATTDADIDAVGAAPADGDNDEATADENEPDVTENEPVVTESAADDTEGETDTKDDWRALWNQSWGNREEDKNA